MSKTKKRLVIKNKGKFTLFLVSIILLVICSTTMLQTKNTNIASANNFPNTVSVYVEKGDTLWDIAINNNPNKKDIRDFVYEIKKYNNLSSYNIFVGDTIIIPLT